MPITRRTVFAALISTMCVSGPLLAATASPSVDAQLAAKSSLFNAPVSHPASMLIQSTQPSQSFLPAPVIKPALAFVPAETHAATIVAKKPDVASDSVTQALDLRAELVAVAMKLRNIRYVRGGRTPTTGFDCSGFVRYVFERSIGLELPTNSASQFLVGQKVSRDDMKTGDLVFFRTAGRRGKGRVSHVGIYISDGQFIHSPRRGETVRVDSLADSYWAKRFAGAKRPEAMAQIDLADHG